MNIVYKLTNIDKSEGKRFYIGSKRECDVVEIEGINCIVSIRTGRRYLSSSQSLEFAEDLKSGNRFDAEVLEVVEGKSLQKLYERESFWIDKMGAVDSDEYYNISNSLKRTDQDAIVNNFGETVKEYASRCSSLSKRDGTARSLGFSNYGLLQMHILNEYDSGKSMAQISKELGRERHFSKATLKGLNSETIKSEIEKASLLQGDLRRLIAQGSSFYKACEILGLNDVVGRIALGDYEDSRSLRVAYTRGYTQQEYEDIVLEETLKYGDFNQASKALGLVKKTYERYLMCALKRRLSPSEA